jgi:hypothetical protein
MMLSERPGPDAPGSCSPSGRWSEPSTSTVLPDRRLPPLASEFSALAGSPLLVCALMKKRITDSSTHATAAMSTYLTARPTHQ